MQHHKRSLNMTCIEYSRRHIDANAPNLPWAGTKQQIETTKQQCTVTTDRDQMDDTICVPSEFAGHHFEKAFGMPGSL